MTYSDVLYIFKIYLVFVAVLLIGSLTIAGLMEDVYGFPREIVILCVMAWAVFSVGLLLALDYRHRLG